MASPPLPGATTVRVLYVEDDAAIRTLVRMVLEGTGRYGVTCCASGAEALERAVEADHDLLLLDVMMPGMDGIETLAALRALLPAPPVPAVFLTARSLASDRPELLAAGAVRIVTKPFLPDRLVAALDEVMAGAQEPRPAAEDRNPVGPRRDPGQSKVTPPSSR